MPMTLMIISPKNIAKNTKLKMSRILWSFLLSGYESSDKHNVLRTIQRLMMAPNNQLSQMERVKDCMRSNTDLFFTITSPS